MTIYQHFSRFTCLVFVLCLMGCTQTIAEPIDLPVEVIETSGLVCRPQQKFITINDSGNAATIWTINKQGQLITQTETEQKNRDWEALAANEKWLFVADTGNNSGQRKGGQIYKYEFTDSEKLHYNSTLNFEFADLPSSLLKPYQHDFDIEAIALRQSDLVLFSKSWSGGPTKVYTLDSSNEQLQKIKPLTEISDLPGIVTDAIWSETHQVFLITGYANLQQNLIALLFSGNWSPFIAVIDKHYQINTVLKLPHAGQLEAICIDENDQVWLSQEQFKESPAKLWRFGSIKILTEPSSSADF